MDIVACELRQHSIFQGDSIRRIGGDDHIGANLGGMREHSSKVRKRGLA